MRLSFIYIFILLLSGCNGYHRKEATPQVYIPGEKAFVVKDVIQTSKYTYLKVSENLGEHWVAVLKTDALVGEKYYYDNALPMKNFRSKELDKEFDNIDFISQISKSPIAISKPKMNPQMNPHDHTGKIPAVKGSKITVDKSESELSIAQLFENPASFNNKQVTIKGKVVKVNKNIMDRNWIHIQDGTEYNKNFELTITSDYLPEINQVASFKGTINLNKDFGAGYFYPVIMENASPE